MLRLALLTSDARETSHRYEEPTPVFGTAPAALIQGFATIPELEVHVVSCSQKQLPSGIRLASNVTFDSLHVPKIGWLRTAYQGCIRAVRKYLSLLRPDIVHGQGTERDCALSAIWSGFPNVLTIHGNMRRIAAASRARPFTFHWLAGRFEAIALPRTAGVVCISSHTRREVQGLARRTWLLPNAVDREFFSIHARPETPARILCVASISALKNQNALIRALDPPTGATPPFLVQFYGDGSAGDRYLAEFGELVRERAWCQHLGFADRITLRRALATATALVLPSLEENCPMCLLEAMAAGVPVIANRVGGVPDLVEDGVNGLLCDPATPAMLAQGVRRMVAEPALAAALAASARKKAESNFRPEIITRRHVEIYREVLAGRPQNSR